MKLAVIIPVYQAPKRLASMLQQLLRNTYADREIIVAVDGETTPAITRALQPFEGRITVQKNEAHLGKVSTLNRIGLASQAEVLLFLDNDILLNDDPEFLTKLARQMEKADIAEIPKEAVTTNLVSSMIHYEFLGFAMATWLFAKLSKHCPSMNGAAFAVNQKWFARLEGFHHVVNEDMDFAARAFRDKAVFGYDRSLKVKNDVPTDLTGWLRQRKRWAYNNLNWLKNHFLYFITHMIKSPRLIIPLLLLLLPFLTVGVLFVGMRSLQLTIFLPAIYMIAQYLHGFAGIFLWITHYQLLINDGLIPSAIALFISLLFHFGFARYFRFHFNFLKFLIFYFIYSPIWILVNLIIWLMAVCRFNIRLEWKV